jgi:tetratricopeptide (TPR) repeat protein
MRDVIRRDPDRMAEYLGGLHESDPAVWQLFEPGLAAMAACQWDQAIEHFRRAQAKAGGAQLVPIYNQTGVCHYMQGRPDDAIKNFEESARLATQYGDEQGKAPALGNIGVVHHDSGELDSALKQMSEALAMVRKSGEERAAAPYLGNIGNVHRDRGELDKALKFYEEALAISREIGDKSGVASCLGSIGSSHCDKGQLAKALKFHEEALSVLRDAEDRGGMASCLGKIGSIHHHRGDLDEALMYYEGALALEREISYQAGVATELGNIGLIFLDKGLHRQAVPTLAESLDILLTIGAAHGLRRALVGLSRCDDRLGRDRVQELLKQTGLADGRTADILDRVDQLRLRRPGQKKGRRAQFVPRRAMAAAR